MPKVLVMDNSKQFDNGMMSNICQEMGIQIFFLQTVIHRATNRQKQLMKL